MADDGPPPTPDWIVTFTDLMSLLLTFFILLLTFSTPSSEKLFELRGSIEAAFGIFSGKTNDQDSTVPPNPILQGREWRNPMSPAVVPRFQDLMERDPEPVLMRLRDRSGEPIPFEALDEGYRIRIADAIAFAPGEVEMEAEAFARLAKIAEATSDAVRNGRFHLAVSVRAGLDELAMLRDRHIDPANLAVERAVRIASRLVERHGLDSSRIAISGSGPASNRSAAAEIILLDRRRFSGGSRGP